MNRWTRWFSSFKKPVPYGDVLDCGATLHKWLGITWYGWPFPLRWRWFARKVWDWYGETSNYWVRRIRRLPSDCVKPGPYLWEAPLFCRACFKGCGCCKRLKDAWKWLKKHWDAGVDNWHDQWRSI